ncbi:Short-chain dehydrogenase TIC 32, chloroplastic [Apostasia shenzhenica]|uniref:Short-chain dehydrogenase TIC 32, chloroplastic n=1 Tax=Apostasia shenzhenica TaxID=1088818 RepID=A0A2H9ZXM7_9ASPA|nr:Short-chain dehydrogenase TIC 32, chloroplastic [Apostasia shenzhenica]
MGWLTLGWKGPSGFSASSTAEFVTEGIDGSGLTAIVTGASNGIGTETSRVLAMRGVHVILGVRNVSAGNNVKEMIVKENPTAKVDVLELDLSSLASVRKFAADFNSMDLPLNILINNAGVVMPTLMLSQDGVEMSFATNHIGHFLLTNLLLENMRNTASESGIEGRIVIVASEGYKLSYREGIRFDKINEESGYYCFCAYGQSKLANILHAQELSDRLKEEGVALTVNSVHPGAVPTNILRHYGLLNGIIGTVAKLVLKDVQQGAATACYVALNSQVKGITGKYFADCNLAQLKPIATDTDLAKKLWDFTKKNHFEYELVVGLCTLVEQSRRWNTGRAGFLSQFPEVVRGAGCYHFFYQ